MVGEEGFKLVPFDRKKAVEVGAAGTTLLFGEDEANTDKNVKEASKKTEDGVALEVAEPKTTPQFFISFSIAIFLLTIAASCPIIELGETEFLEKDSQEFRVGHRERPSAEIRLC